MNKPLVMVALMGTTPEEFIVEQLEQRHGLTRAQADKAVEGVKERGLYDGFLVNAREALKELHSHLQGATTSAVA